MKKPKPAPRPLPIPKGQWVEIGHAHPGELKWVKNPFWRKRSTDR